MMDENSLEERKSTRRESDKDPKRPQSISVRVRSVDAKWKRIQQNTFTRWVNQHLKKTDQSITDLAIDFSDGLKLIALVEVLSGKNMWKHNKKPNFRPQKFENVSIALEFLEKEGVVLVNVDSSHIVDCTVKLILGLIWRLILHYAISVKLDRVLSEEEDQQQPGEIEHPGNRTPKQRLMDWVNEKMTEYDVKNFTSNWKDGKAIGALVDSVAPGLCPNWEDWNPNQPVENAAKAMDLANEWLDVPKLLTPEEMVNPDIDEQSMMTYISQFPSAKLKPGAPLKQKINENNVIAYGPGLESAGLVTNILANFTVETVGAGDGELTVQVVGESGQHVHCEAVFNNDKKDSYNCSYMTGQEGEYIVHVLWSKRNVPESPYSIQVESPRRDVPTITVVEPGLEIKGGITIRWYNLIRVKPIHDILVNFLMIYIINFNCILLIYWYKVQAPCQTYSRLIQFYQFQQKHMLL